jgi:hypothetical protein
LGRERNFGDTWQWDGTTWQLVSVTGPPNRHDAAVADIEPDGSVVLFGGRGTSLIDEEQEVVLGDTWRWNGRLWEPSLFLSNLFAPTPRYGHGFVKGLMWGGCDFERCRDALPYLYRGRGLESSWLQMYPEGPSPQARMQHGIATVEDQPAGADCDPICGRVDDQFLLMGGETFAGELLGDTWTFDGTWTLHTDVRPPGARSGHAMAHVPAINKVVMFGGKGTAGLRNDTWIWDGQWRRLK